jgi:hypothetical protein
MAATGSRCGNGANRPNHPASLVRADMPQRALAHRHGRHRQRSLDRRARVGPADNAVTDADTGVPVESP